MVTKEDVIQVAEYLHIELNQSIIDEVLRQLQDYEYTDQEWNKFQAIERVLYNVFL